MRFELFDADFPDTGRVELGYTAASAIRVRISNRDSSQDIELGKVSHASPFDVLLTIRPGEPPRARIAGSLPVAGKRDILAGFSALSVGRSGPGPAAWDGDEPLVELLYGGGAEQFYGLMDDTIHAEGDSFIRGHGGVQLPRTLQALMRRPVYNTGVGGATMTEARDRLLAASPAIRNKLTVIWDGSENPIRRLHEVSGYVDLLATGIATLGHQRFIVIPACANFGEADMTLSDAIASEMRRRWPDNFLDWRGFLPLVAPGSYPAADMFLGLPADTTHLRQAAMDRAAAAIRGFIEAKGW